MTPRGALRRLTGALLGAALAAVVASAVAPDGLAAGPAGRIAGRASPPPVVAAGPADGAAERTTLAGAIAAADPVLVGAGDIADCRWTADSRTASLLDGIDGRVFAAGDLAYPRGTARQFKDCYGPTWGRVLDRTSPAVGNHEYGTAGARGYFDYFGDRAGAPGRGWYAFDLGTWRVYVLNSNCDQVGCGRTSKQGRWLHADLIANPRACVAAIWHHPLFSSGEHGDNRMVRPLWKALAEAGADVVLAGHDHDYERFAPQTTRGRPLATKIREFVVGTGGAPLRSFERRAPNSVVRNATAHGVLALTLRPTGYDWRFVPVAGESWHDEGSADCH